MSKKKSLVLFLILVVALVFVLGVLFIFLLINNSGNEQDNKESNKQQINSTEEATISKTTPVSVDPPLDNVDLLTEQQKNEYYKKGKERFYIYYRVADAKEREVFEKEIAPVLRQYIAYSEYQIEKYEPLFKSDDSEDISNLKIQIFKDFDDVNLSGELQYRYIIANASEFTYTVTCFFDYKKHDITEKDIAKTATHETTHLLQYSYSKDTTAVLPTWFKEGMVMYYEYFPFYLQKKYPDILNSGTFPADLEELEEGFSSKDYDERIFHYIVAEQFYRYLTKEVEPQDLISLLTSDWRDFGEDYKSITGRSLTKDYSSFISKKR